MNTEVSNKKPVWTAERVALLKRLWLDGVSASQIARILSTPEQKITGNAVIGKVHRLKLQQRIRPYQSKVIPELEEDVSNPIPPPQSTSSPAVVRDEPRIARVVEKSPPLPKPKPLEVPKDGRITILHLSDKTCKWPIGYPGEEDFCFCGHLPRTGSSYCDFHARAAYQPAQDRRIKRAG